MSSPCLLPGLCHLSFLHLPPPQVFLLSPLISHVCAGPDILFLDGLNKMLKFQLSPVFKRCLAYLSVNYRLKFPTSHFVPQEPQTQYDGKQTQNHVPVLPIHFSSSPSLAESISHLLFRLLCHPFPLTGRQALDEFTLQSLICDSSFPILGEFFLASCWDGMHPCPDCYSCLQHLLSKPILHAAARVIILHMPDPVILLPSGFYFTYRIKWRCVILTWYFNL